MTIIDAEKLFTFKQRADELMKALKRKWTEERQAELNEIKSHLESIGEKLSGKLHRKSKLDRN